MITDLEPFVGRAVSRETLGLLERYAELLRAGAEHQNLIARSTLGHIWARHIADSAQLVRFEPRPGASWIDIGSGAGLPGIVIATLVDGPVFLAEPRRLRVDFLNATVAELGLDERVDIIPSKATAIRGRYDVITARAVGSLTSLLVMTLHLSHPGTVWVLPKGRSAKSELAEARRSWHCDATVEESMTDPESGVLVLRNIRSKGRG